jgi:DNA repair protein RadC
LDFEGRKSLLKLPKFHLELLDHLIITPDNKFFSFGDEGLI